MEQKIDYLKNISDAQTLIHSTITWAKKLKSVFHGKNNYVCRELNSLEKSLRSQNMRESEKIELINIKLNQINNQIQQNKVERLTIGDKDYTDVLRNLEKSSEKLL